MVFVGHFGNGKNREKAQKVPSDGQTEKRDRRSKTGMIHGICGSERLPKAVSQEENLFFFLFLEFAIAFFKRKQSQ